MRALIGGVMIAACATSVSAMGGDKRAHSLDGVPALIENASGAANYRNQMAGTPLPDGFGTTLPAGIDARRVVALIAPDEDAARATLVGMKPWPRHPGRYVAIACFAPDADARAEALRDNDGRPTCEMDADRDDGPQPVHLGVIAYAPGATPTAVATSGPLDIRMRWEGTDGPSPARADDTAGVLPETFVRFDLAPYTLTDEDEAFGLRMGWNEGYAGGGGYFEALALFRVDGDRLVEVLAEPMYYMQNIAGDWHDDGTRDHDLLEGTQVLSVLPHRTNGVHDLRIREAGAARGRTFVWNPARRHYVPAARTAK